MKKTHYMIITSARKKVQPICINGLEQKKYIKYLGVYIDQHLKWEPQIQHIHNKLSKNIGIINKLRYFINLKLLRLLYYSLIYPYLHYAIISWGNTYKTKLDKIRTKQNTCVRRIFFARNKESAIPYFSLLEILTLDNVLKMKTASLTHRICNKSSFNLTIPSIFDNMLKRSSDIHSHNTRFASQMNFSRPKPRTNYGKFTFQFLSSHIWQTIPLNIKVLSPKQFKTRYKSYLLKNQK